MKQFAFFIARDMPHAARAFAQRAFEAGDRLRQFSRSGRVVPEFNDPDLREIILASYRLIYMLRAEDVEILAVHPAAKPLDAGGFLRGS